ncbi:MAG: peptide-methionine (S)-S-oxide reductase MsrA [Deltaproteobacteria bacterium]|nr:peptide-methionine (S)-S-oxide reductase MsrA [Deltaproteobacteria bacterium]
MKEELATLAGGCFWGIEAILQKVHGVICTQVGYTGGHVPDPTYPLVKKGDSGHAEAVQVTFDPDQISYKELLHMFFRLHDPTTLNRQGHDVGTQYRSAIFYHSEGQRDIAKQVKEEIDKLGTWSRPLVTEIVSFEQFFPAEEYHQKYLQKNPGGYTCHYLREEKK